ncbi:GIY-YIG nuclease family protein [Mongoliitalea daihaiensis]|uniref:GIY-YIG nuclease family protein n=1 Tax=Mongoliitalea daihaiensis TaxID=2782006 RepID=UPI001F4331DF|nr:GIY-YIG nuclease family protein [Mongoliitalea daihaiensis]UJP67028.1 GIY-YIG nuclease family protein [Mongoliitalea daihaiensis]
MYFVYIIYSSKTDKFYIGSTDNLESRLKHHNSRLTPSTKSGAPFWEVVYTETVVDRTTALKREIEIKRKKSRKYILSLIENSSAG